MLARAMDALALKIRMTDSTTPAEFEDREETLDLATRMDWETIGFERARAACRCHEPAGSAFGHMA